MVGLWSESAHKGPADRLRVFHIRCRHMPGSSALLSPHSLLSGDGRARCIRHNVDIQDLQEDDAQGAACHHSSLTLDPTRPTINRMSLCRSSWQL